VNGDRGSAPHPASLVKGPLVLRTNDLCKEREAERTVLKPFSLLLSFCKKKVGFHVFIFPSTISTTSLHLPDISLS
jgi:hypothetical protein